MGRNKLQGVWTGWTYKEDEKVLFDSDGNHYYMDEIRSLFYLRQLHSLEVGKKADILFFKSELKKRIDQSKMPTVTIDWGEVQETIIHPWNRKT